MNKKNGILRFVDIDETVFHTTAKIKIRDRNGGLLKTLSNKEWNTYPREDIISKKEFVDFGEFADANKFFNESTPIMPMIEKLRKWSYEMKTDPNRFDDKIVFVTARGDFDDREKFLDTFRQQLIAVDDKKHFYISRTGNLSDDARINGMLLSTAQRKKIEYLHFLIAKTPAVVELYEDDMKNIEDFLELKNEMPLVKFKAFLVKDGKIKEVKQKS